MFWLSNVGLGIVYDRMLKTKSQMTFVNFLNSRVASQNCSYSGCNCTIDPMVSLWIGFALQEVLYFQAKCLLFLAKRVSTVNIFFFQIACLIEVATKTGFAVFLKSAITINILC